jgi:vacuolar-type H+-ATPase catalytic subunit A/Vma1
LDDVESIYREDPDWLCDISIGEVVEVEHRVSYELDQDPVFTAIQWDEEYSEALNEINSNWCTWQAAKAQAVPEGFVLVDKHQLAQLMANMDSFGKKALGDDYVSFADIAAVLDEAQEPTND